MSSGELNWPTPMKAIGAQNLLTMPGGVTISGYLHKRGGKQLQLFKWPLRYVIIHKGCVYYFKCSTSATSQGAFSLNGYNRVMRAAEETTSHNVFPFKMVHISKKHRTWYFSAASEEERKKWMLNLRKEIDHYHEKKETYTDLSDTDTDTDSFYGSVERPVDIKYTHNPADDSWQDEDDDEEDYERPDGVDDAPTYPPPPIPRLPKHQAEETSRRLSLNDILGTPKPPSPLPRPYTAAHLDLTHLNKGYNMKNGSPDSSVKTPPIPTLPPAHRAEEKLTPPPPPPIPSIRRVHDKTENVLVCPRKDPPGPFVPRNKKTPSPTHQLPSHPVVPILTRPRNDSLSKDIKPGFQPPPVFNDLLSKELSKKFNNTPPSVPKKPIHMVAPIENIPPVVPPVPKNKPKILVEVNKSPETPSPPIIKPVLPKPRTVPKTHLSSMTHNSGFPPILRSSPDGQSIKDVPIEENSDSDDDYEKVALPATVFVDTCESADIESMFKAADTRGDPPTGLFCIRNSSRGGKVLVVWDGDIVRLRNYRIFEKGSKFYLEAEILFSDIESLIEHYYKNKLPSHENLILKYAYGYSSHPR